MLLIQPEVLPLVARDVGEAHIAEVPREDEHEQQRGHRDVGRVTAGPGLRSLGQHGPTCQDREHDGGEDERQHRGRELGLRSSPTNGSSSVGRPASTSLHRAASLA